MSLSAHSWIDMMCVCVCVCVVCVQTIRWDQGNGKKLSTKTRSGYDDKLVE